METLPPEIEAFFNQGGVLPEALEAEAQQADTPAEAVADVADEVAEKPVVETPVDTSAAELKRMIADQQKVLRDLQDDVRKRSERETADKAPKAPDPETDPLGHLNHQLKTIQDQIAALKAANDATAKETAEQRQVREFIDHVNGQIAAFKTDNPDYDAAYKHLETMKKQDYMDIGLSPDEALGRVRQDELQIAVKAVEQGKNPADVIYKMSKRYGYVKSEAKEKPPVADKLKSIKEGMKAEKQTEREAPPAGELDVDALHNASDEDLEKFVRGGGWSKLSGRQGSVLG